MFEIVRKKKKNWMEFFVREEFADIRNHKNANS